VSTRRNEILKELGLSPLWVLRPVREGRGAGACPGAAEAPPALAEAQTASQAPSARAAGDGGSPADPGRDDRRESILKLDWVALRAAVAGCTACGLHARRNQTVFGVGDEHAEWMFVGEGPGAEEDLQGEPFVGQAGRLLDNMLAAIGLGRGRNVFIANVVKCRPPGNRNPEPEEAAQCEPFLQRQIELVNPKLIVALGRVAAQNLLAREASIASLRGRLLDYRGIPLIVTYHPAYLLRNLVDKAKAWEDLCFAVGTMEALRAGRSSAGAS
jgi:uracil-DNA glycosylase